MQALVRNANDLAHAASLFLGLIAILAAAVALLSPLGPTELAGWALEVLGVGFLAVLAALEMTAIFAVVKMMNATRDRLDFWQSVAVQAAAGITTLALTFTLLGISLGIGSLAGQALTPETVQEVIRDLTANFSLAFMTTVIGLPSAALLKSIAVVAGNRRRLLINEQDEGAEPITLEPTIIVEPERMTS